MVNQSSTARRRDISRLAYEAHSLQSELASPTSGPSKLYRKSLAYFGRENMRRWAALRSLPPSTSNQSIMRLAARIDPFATEQNVVFWRRIAKRSRTGYRFICDAPATLKASSYLIKDVLTARFRPANHIYDIKGRGRDAAARATKEALEAGYRCCFVGDVRDCYQHVDVAALADRLPLPRPIVERCLDYRSLTLRERGHSGDTGALFVPSGSGWNGPRGLLQGLPSSSIILAMLFNDMATQVEPHDCVLVLYGDNLFIAAQSDATLTAIIALIRDYFHEHPAGPFDLKGSSRRVFPEDGFEFLSYLFSAVEGSAFINFNDFGWLRAEEAIDAAIEIDALRGDGNARAAEQAIRDHFSGYRSINGWHSRLDQKIEDAADQVMQAYWAEFA